MNTHVYNIGHVRTLESGSCGAASKGEVKTMPSLWHVILNRESRSNKKSLNNGTQERQGTNTSNNEEENMNCAIYPSLDRQAKYYQMDTHVKKNCPSSIFLGKLAFVRVEQHQNPEEKRENTAQKKKHDIDITKKKTRRRCADKEKEKMTPKPYHQKKRSFVDATLIIAFHIRTQVATLRIFKYGPISHSVPSQWKLLYGRNNIKRSTNDDDDNDNDETQSMFPSTNLSIIQDIGLVLCTPMLGCRCCWCAWKKVNVVASFIAKSNNVAPIDNWIDYSKVAPLFDK
ncbi:hypothetical protein RFI_37019 [Reticulomyxa filosa]|uniref:Uncharacterized protein n=1 Tax=Reticulomyxa filosa TaxID=46433 RepID=X6LIA5_RETFI|nr:hypothetical protein RFI_37019 [Reticulomyxa filosa]|eukprot:ETO00425.1 hypothetical protein RFI_37019 [Reticulomyxa filosa]